MVGELSPLAFRFARFRVRLAGVDLAFWAAVDDATGLSTDSVYLEDAVRDSAFPEEGLGHSEFNDDLGENIRCGMVHDSVPALCSAIAGLHLGPEHRVLELGAGMGLPGLVAAAMGGQVVLSDRHPGVLELLGRNIVINKASTAQARKLSWTDRPPWLADFDFVLAADVLYAKDAAPAFFAAAAAALRPGGILVMAHKTRTSCCDLLHDALPEALALGFVLCSGAAPALDGVVEVFHFTKGAVHPSCIGQDSEGITKTSQRGQPLLLERR